jgi:hypothetical protein
MVGGMCFIELGVNRNNRSRMGSLEGLAVLPGLMEGATDAGGNGKGNSDSAPGV